MQPRREQAQCLSAIMVSIPGEDRDAGVELPEQITPLAKEQKTPGHDELAHPVGDVHIWVVFRFFQQDREALDRVLACDAVVRRGPRDEVTVDQMRCNHITIARKPNLGKRAHAITGVLCIPTARPDATYEATRPDPGAQKGIAQAIAEFERAFHDLKTPLGTHK